jgi:hypothetical protein
LTGLLLRKISRFFSPKVGKVRKKNGAINAILIGSNQLNQTKNTAIAKYYGNINKRFQNLILIYRNNSILVEIFN